LIGGRDGLLVKFGINAPLPVLYKSFNAQLQKDNSVALNWTSSSEYNASHFEIEKSADAKTWKKLGQLNAQGNSQIETNYQMMDDAPFTGTMYYRIKQVDNDNQYSYSTVESVNKIGSNDISIYPNPCNMILNISNLESEQPSTIEIYSMDGRRVLAEQSQNVNHKINVNTLAKGTYILRVFNSEKTFTTKFERK
jgi:hypothetical protein